jgi:tetratricopeptide (TPR) repeat protein
MGDLKLAAFCVQHAAFLNESNNRKTTTTESLEESIENMRLLSGTNKNRRHRVLPVSQQSFHTHKTSVNSSITQQSLVYSFLKNYNKAIEILDHEIKLKPSSELFNLLGRVFMKAKRWSDAIISFDKSIDLNSEEIRSVNRSVMNMSTFSQHLNKGTKKDLIDSYFMKGQCLIELNKYQEAYNAFDKVIELKPDSAKVTILICYSLN